MSGPMCEPNFRNCKVSMRYLGIGKDGGKVKYERVLNFSVLCNWLG